MGGCVLLFFSLGWNPTIKYFLIWAAIGLVVYFLYARNRSHLAPGNEKLLHGYGDPLPAAPLVHEGPEPGP
jgi:APA family basic amino acid/polyamine antiporter